MTHTTLSTGDPVIYRLRPYAPPKLGHLSHQTGRDQWGQPAAGCWLVRDAHDGRLYALDPAKGARWRKANDADLRRYTTRSFDGPLFAGEKPSRRRRATSTSGAPTYPPETRRSSSGKPRDPEPQRKQTQTGKDIAEVAGNEIEDELEKERKKKEG